MLKIVRVVKAERIAFFFDHFRKTMCRIPKPDAARLLIYHKWQKGLHWHPTKKGCLWDPPLFFLFQHFLFMSIGYNSFNPLTNKKNAQQTREVCLQFLMYLQFLFIDYPKWRDEIMIIILFDLLFMCNVSIVVCLCEYWNFHHGKGHQ